MVRVVFGASFFDLLLLLFCDRLFDRFLDHFGPLWEPFGVHLALWGRPLAHFELQMGALGTSLGAFGGPSGPSGVDLGDLGRLLAPTSS